MPTISSPPSSPAATALPAPGEVVRCPNRAPNRAPDSATPEDSDSTAALPVKAKRAKKASKRTTKKSAPRPMFDEADP